jgi:hypothetical protein
MAMAMGSKTGNAMVNMAGRFPAKALNLAVSYILRRACAITIVWAS